MFRRYLAILRRRWWLLPFGVLVAALAAAAVSSTMPPRYESTARVMAGPATRSDYWTLRADDEVAKTFAQLATARPVLEAVISNLRLSTDPEALARRVRVTLLPEARLFDVTVEADSAEQAAAIANGIAEQLAVFGSGGQRGDGALAQQVQQDLARLDEQTRAAEQELGEVNQQIAAAERARADTAELRRRRDALQERLVERESTRARLYDTLLRSSGSTIAVVSPAAPPTREASLGLVPAVALAAILGLVLASGLAFGLDLLDDRVHTPEQLPADGRLPYLGGVPRFPRARKPAETLVALAQPRSPVAESFRAIRTILRGLAPADGRQVLLFTSARLGEGKTITVANLGVLLAQSGKRVVLVDADLRKPGLHQLFAQSSSVGLTSALGQQAPTATPYLVETGVANLHLLPSGPPVTNPADLLASDQAARLLASLRSWADVVLVDSPPVLAVTDAAVLAPHVDYTVMVGRAGRTTATEIEQACDVLLAAGGRLAGIVLTRADARWTSYLGYGRYPQREGAMLAPLVDRSRQRGEALPGHPFVQMR